MCDVMERNWKHVIQTDGDNEVIGYVLQIGQTYWNGLCLMLYVYHLSSCRYEQREPNIRDLNFGKSAIVQSREIVAFLFCVGAGLSYPWNPEKWN